MRLVEILAASLVLILAASLVFWQRRSYSFAYIRFWRQRTNALQLRLLVT
jgi:hypothetical protein